MSESCIRWIGDLDAEELLWPQDLPEAEIIDLGGITAVGIWVHAWFRAHPNQGVVGARPDVRRQLEAAGLPILFRDPQAIGVTATERSALLNDFLS